jgi:hypothetical protein
VGETDTIRKNKDSNGGYYKDLSKRNWTNYFDQDRKM